MTPKSQKGATQGPAFGTTEEKFLVSPSPQIVCLPRKEEAYTGPQNGKCGSWSPGWPGPQAHDIRLQLWVGPRDAQGHGFRAKVARLPKYMQVFVSAGLDQVSGYSGPKEWGTPGLGKRGREKSSEKLPKLPLP